MTEHSTHHDIWKLYNNIGIGVIAISSVMDHLPKITLTNALLILPLITHAPTLSYLSRKTTKIPSSTSLIISHPELFINFNDRLHIPMNYGHLIRLTWTPMHFKMDTHSKQSWTPW